MLHRTLFIENWCYQTIETFSVFSLGRGPPFERALLVGCLRMSLDSAILFFLLWYHQAAPTNRSRHAQKPTTPTAMFIAPPSLYVRPENKSLTLTKLAVQGFFSICNVAHLHLINLIDIHITHSPIYAIFVTRQLGLMSNHQIVSLKTKLLRNIPQFQINDWPIETNRLQKKCKITISHWNEAINPTFSGFIRGIVLPAIERAVTLERIWYAVVSLLTSEATASAS